MDSKILSLSLRPDKLDSLIGLDSIVKTLKSQFESKRIPHFYIISGPTGSGKTTLARIISRILQFEDITKVDYTIPINKYDIKEINASDKNGVDDVRNLIGTIYHMPFSRSKVFILDEAHQLTNQAQNALLKVAEDTPKGSYIIFCTNNDSKILATLKRRAYIINTHGIDKKSINQLLTVAKKETGYNGEITELVDTLEENGINTPGLILQAAEKYFNGIELNDCVFGSDISNTIDTKKLCNLLSKGDFKTALPLLKKIKKEDIVLIRTFILGYFKAILLNSGSVKHAQAMKIIGEECYDLPIFLSNICLACNKIKSV